MHPDAPVLVDDAALVATMRAALPGRVEFHASAGIDDLIAEQIEALADPVAMLPGGARCSIYPTPALTAIDIDAGAALAANRGGKTAVHAALNERVLPALASQIRLRNLSGAIFVDFAGLSHGRRRELCGAFARELGRDPLPARVLGLTGLGLVELVRPRVHPPLHELLAGSHAAGLAALRQLAREPHRVLRAAPAVVRALEADPAALRDFARRTGRAAELRSDPSLPDGTWVIA
jgi:Ribonuclease G/E